MKNHTKTLISVFTATCLAACGGGVSSDSVAVSAAAPPPTTYMATGSYCYGVTALITLGQESVTVFMANPLTAN